MMNPCKGVEEDKCNMKCQWVEKENHSGCYPTRKRAKKARSKVNAMQRTSGNKAASKGKRRRTGKRKPKSRKRVPRLIRRLPNSRKRVPKQIKRPRKPIRKPKKENAKTA